MTTRMDRERCLASWMCTAYCPDPCGALGPPIAKARTAESASFWRTRRRSNNSATLSEKRAWQAAFSLHSFVSRPTAALGHNPVDDLIRIRDVAGLAVHAVGEVNLQLHCTACFFGHLVHRGRAKILARITVFFDAPCYANVCVQDMQMARLIFVVARA